MDSRAFINLLRHWSLYLWIMDVFHLERRKKSAKSLDNFCHFESMDKNCGTIKRLTSNFELFIAHKYSCFQATFYVCVNGGLDLAQIWVTPSPNFCFFKNFIKNPPILMTGLSLSFATVLKLYFLITKSVPEMDEADVAKKAIFIITVSSSVLSGIKFSGDTKPTFNQVMLRFMKYLAFSVYLSFSVIGNLYGIL